MSSHKQNLINQPLKKIEWFSVHSGTFQTRNLREEAQKEQQNNFLIRLACYEIKFHCSRNWLLHVFAWLIIFLYVVNISGQFFPIRLAYINIPLNPISLKWGLFRPGKDESIDYFRIGLTQMSIFLVFFNNTMVVQKNIVGGNALGSLKTPFMH